MGKSRVNYTQVKYEYQTKKLIEVMNFFTFSMNFDLEDAKTVQKLKIVQIRSLLAAVESPRRRRTVLFCKHLCNNNFWKRAKFQVPIEIFTTTMLRVKSFLFCVSLKTFGLIYGLIYKIGLVANVILIIFFIIGGNNFGGKFFFA